MLKRFYINKKKETRKQATKERSNLVKTGGGAGEKIANDPVFSLTLDILNKKTVFGLTNKFDGDALVLLLLIRHASKFLFIILF